MKFLTRLERSPSFWFLALSSFLFFLLRLPSLFEPYWYGDEGIYQAVGMLIRAGHPLYSGAWDNKPPLLYLMYALFNSDQFALRSLSLIFGIFSTWFIFLISDLIFPKSRKISYLITVIYVLGFGTRLIEGNIANAENFMLFPILLSAFLVLKSKVKENSIKKRLLFISGIILSLAFLTKIVAAFDLVAFSAFVFITSEEKIKAVIRNELIPFFGGFGIPVVIAVAYFLITNNFRDFLNAFLLGNVGYVGYGNTFFIPQGLLYLKLIVLFLFVVCLYLQRKRLSYSFIFINLWFALSLFNAFFSQRPYTHYLLVLLPSFCLMIGLVITQKANRYFSLGFLILGFLFVTYSFGFKGKNLAYYENFVSYCLGKKSTEAYQNFFDRNTPRDYKLASFIKLNTSQSDSIFIWGNNAEVYKLSNKTPIMRYVVAYHITQYPGAVSEMKTAISTKKPKLILVMPKSSVPLTLPNSNYTLTLNIDGVLIYEKTL